MKRQQRVVQGGRGAARAKRQPRHLGDPPFDYDRLERQPYLTIPELCAYGSFKTKKAAYAFLAKWDVAWGAGRVRRREFDRAWERATERRHVA